MTRTIAVAVLAVSTFAGCGGNDDAPTERADGGSVPTDDPDDMTATEHREAACDEIDVVLRSAPREGVHGDQLDYIISHTAAADDEPLDESANDWADGISDGDARVVDDAAARLVDLCDLRPGP